MSSQLILFSQSNVLGIFSTLVILIDPEVAWRIYLAPCLKFLRLGLSTYHTKMFCIKAYLRISYQEIL
jgi:hypothetical protein